MVSRLPRTVRNCGAAAERPGGDRPAVSRLPVLREPLSHGHTRVPCHVLFILRRLPLGLGERLQRIIFESQLKRLRRLSKLKYFIH